MGPSSLKIQKKVTTAKKVEKKKRHDFMEREVITDTVCKFFKNDLFAMVFRVKQRNKTRLKRLFSPTSFAKSEACL